tara:strand:- start:879 stop:1226 length:348 start_codon:yes stop_codon:yes gene_type:complete
MRSAVVCILLLVASMAMVLATAKPCPLSSQSLELTSSQSMLPVGVADVAAEMASAVPLCVAPLDVVVTQEDRSELISVPVKVLNHCAGAIAASPSLLAGAMPDRRERLLRPPQRA